MNEQEFQQRVVQALEPHSDALVSALRQLVAHTYPSEVAAIDFEVFPDGFTSGFPVRAFFMDANNNEFFLFEGTQARYPNPIDPGLLKIDRVYCTALEQALSESNPDADYYTLAAQSLVPWFSRCWAKAGGLQFARQARIGLHDDPRIYDLVSQFWCVTG